MYALSGSVYFKSLLWDEEYYHKWAQAILANNVPFLPSNEYAPLPAYFMAIVYKFFGSEVVFIRYANIVLGTGACWVIYLISKELVGKWYALLALFCAALCKPLIFYSVVVLKTSLAIFLFGLLIYLVLFSRRQTRQNFKTPLALLGNTTSYNPSAIRGEVLCGPDNKRKDSLWIKILLGVTFGLLFNVRPNVLILLPVLPLLICPDPIPRLHNLHYLIKSATSFVTGFIFAVSPFVLQNYLTYGHLQIIPLQSGFLFYANNNKTNATPYYQPVPFASSHPKEQGIQYTIEASRRTGKKMTMGEASAYWRKQVLLEIMENPLHGIKRTAQKVHSFLSFSEYDDHYQLGFIGSTVPWFSIPFFPYWFFFLLGMTGLTGGTLRKQRHHDLWALTVITFLYALTLILYSSGNRFQLPLLVILIPATIYTIKELINLSPMKNPKDIAAYLFLLLFFTVAGLSPIDQQTALASQYNTYAFLLDKNGQEKEAIKWWEKSASLNEPYSAYANLFLSGKFYQMYGRRKAVETLNKISDDSFAAAAKYAVLGDIELHHGSIEQAKKLYKKSLEINSGQRRIRRELIHILQYQKENELEGEIERLQFISSFYN